MKNDTVQSISDKQYIPISKFSKLIGKSNSSIRNYETLGIIHPIRDKRGNRMYSQDDIEKLRQYTTSQKKLKIKVTQNKNLSVNNHKYIMSDLFTLKVASILFLLSISLLGVVFYLTTSSAKFVPNGFIAAYRDIQKSDGIEGENNVLSGRIIRDNFQFNVDLPPKFQQVTECLKNINLTRSVIVSESLTTPRINQLEEVDDITKDTLEKLLDIRGEVISAGLGTTIIQDKVIIGSKLSPEIIYEGTLNIAGELQLNGTTIETTAEEINILANARINSFDELLRSSEDYEFENGTLSFAEGTLLDLSAINQNSTTPQGLKLPQSSTFSNISSGEGFIACNTLTNTIMVFDGTSWNSVSGGGSPHTADGEGIELSGTQFLLELDGTSLSKSASGLRISPSYAGQATITTLGTITTGTWNATTINVGYGGTGATSFTSNGVLYGNGTGAIQATAAGTNGYVLYSNSGTPDWHPQTSINAGTLDSLDSSDFLRSNTNDSYEVGTLSMDVGTILDINGDISIADSFITLDGISTTFTQSTSYISFIPAAGYNFEITLSSRGDFVVNTDDLYVDTSTGNVGINDAIPTNGKLEVNATQNSGTGKNTIYAYGTNNSSSLGSYMSTIDVAAENAATSNNSNVRGLNIWASTNNSNSNKSAYGIYSNVYGNDSLGGNNIGALYGIYSPAYAYYDTNTAVGGAFQTVDDSSGAVITTAKGLQAYADSGTKSYGLDITGVYADTTAYGIRIQNVSSSGTNAYSLYINDITAGTNQYSIHQAGRNDRNHLARALKNGSTASASLEQLEVNGRIYLADSTAPGTTTNRLYSVSGSLYWNGTQLGTNNETAGQIAAFNGSCPTGWTEFTSARGRTIVGTPSGGTNAGTVGTAFSNLENRTHTHSFSGTTGITTNNYSAADAGGNNSVVSAAHTHAFSGTTGTSSTSNVIPYIQLTYCSKDAGSDLAEWTPSEEILEAGQIVSIDENNKEKISKSNTDYDSKVAGIISTQPGWLIGEKTTGNEYMLALSGRVPTKVNLKNGAIKSGDLITTSTLPGIGMKATKAGHIVGKAMEDLNSDSSLEDCTDPTTGEAEKCGTILVFVNLGWNIPKYEELESKVASLAAIRRPQDSQEASQSTSSQELFASMQTLLDQFNNLLTTLGISRVEENLFIESATSILGTTTLSDTTITRDLNVGLMKFDSIANSIEIVGPSCYNEATNTLNSELCEAQAINIAGNLAGNVSIFNSKIEFTPKGDIKFKGKIYASEDSAGEIKILSGTNYAQINFTNSYENSPIVVATAINSTLENNSYAITDITQNGFRIILNFPTDEDIKFNWIEVGKNYEND